MVHYFHSILARFDSARNKNGGWTFIHVSNLSRHSENVMVLRALFEYRFLHKAMNADLYETSNILFIRFRVIYEQY